MNLRAGELRRNGARIKLQEQPFQVLALLLEKPGELVTREELRAKLWPADTFVDFDHGLNAAVKRLRDALGDSAENPRFIETLARRGYRFVAPIPNGAIDSKARAELQRNGAPQFRNFWTRAAAGLAVLAMGAGAGWVMARRFNPQAHIVEQRLTANPLAEPVLGAVISPDNRYLAFADKAGVYLRIEQGGETHRVVLPEGLNARPTSWFPDSAHVLLTSSLIPSDKMMMSISDKPSLWNASVFGGTPRKLIDGGESGIVSPDGKQIIFFRSAAGWMEIWWMRADGQNARKLIGEPQHLYSSLAWAPSGDRFAYVDGVFHPTYGDGERSIRVYHLDSGKTDSVLGSARLATGLAWTADGRLIYSQTEPPPNQADSNLWAQRVDRATDKPMGQPVRLTSGPDAKTNVSASADGKHLVFLRTTWDTDIYVATMHAARAGLASIEPLHLEQHRQFPYAWTPDNKSVIYVSDRDGSFHLFKQAADQLTPDVIFADEYSVTLTRPNPDYSGLLFLAAPKASEASAPTRLMQIPLSGGTPRLILEDNDMHNFQCARAPSAVCVYNKDAAGRILFFTFDLATGKKTPLLDLAVAEWENWTLSPDGSTLAMADCCHFEPDPKIDLLSIRDGAKRAIPVGPQLRISSIDFAADSRSIWTVLQEMSGTRQLVSVDLNGHIRPMYQESQKTLGWAIPSPDGRHLAFWEATGSSNAWLLQGF